MTTLAMDPLTLGHTAITLIAIFTGLVVLLAMVRGDYRKGWTAVFLLFTVLTSATGYLLPPTVPPPTPAQIVGAIPWPIWQSPSTPYMAHASRASGGRAMW